MAVPTGYTCAQVLTVTNTAATTLGGSTAAPVATSSTDYVVNVQVTGAAAAQIFANVNLHGATGFADLAVFYNGTQIDVDPDQGVFGAWSASNVSFWFKLQAPIAASASDAGYLLAYGKTAGSSLATKNALANIWPFADDFIVGQGGTTATAVDPANWTNTTTVSISNSIATFTSPTVNASTTCTSIPTWGDNYSILLRGNVKPITLGTKENDFAWRGIGSTFVDYYANPGQAFIREYNGNGGFVQTRQMPPPDSSTHTYALARDATGQAYGNVDSLNLLVTNTGSAQITTASLPVQVVLANTASDLSTMQITADWIKVRPWVTSEPTTTPGALQSLPAIAVAPGTPSCVANQTIQFTATPASGSPSIAWSVSGGGTISSTGFFTASAAGGPYTVSATATGYKDGLAAITVLPIGLLSVTPLQSDCLASGTRQFTAAGMVGSPTITWSVSGGGSISGTGLFTADAAAGGPYTITASNPGYTAGIAAVRVLASNTSHATTRSSTARTAGIRSYAPPAPISTPVTMPGGVTDLSTLGVSTVSAPAQPITFSAGQSAGLTNVTGYYLQTVNGVDHQYIMNADSGTSATLHVFDILGNELTPLTFGASYPGPLLTYVDTSGNIFVMVASVLHKFDSTGTHLAATSAVAGSPGCPVLQTVAGPAFNAYNSATWVDQNLATLPGRPTALPATFLTLEIPPYNPAGAPYVTARDQNGTLLTYCGPFSSGHVIEGAAVAPDGNYIVSVNNVGVSIVRPDGSLVGLIKPGQLVRTDGSQIVGNMLKFATTFKGAIYFLWGGMGSGNPVCAIPYSTLLSLAAIPSGQVNVFAPGVSLATTATANYYSAGQTPSMSLVVDNWMCLANAGLAGTYTIRERDDLVGLASGFTGSFTIPTSTGSVTQRIPLPLPSAYQGTGFYRVDATLLRSNGQLFGTITGYYAVGAPGGLLNFAGLPGTPQASNMPSDRNTALSGMLGYKYVRLGHISSSPLYDAIPANGRTDSAVPMTFPQDAVYQNAAAIAATYGTTLIAMCSENGNDATLVSNGTYAARVQQFVAHYSAAPFNIQYYECWNEVTQYTNQRPAGQPDLGSSAKNFAVYVQKVFYNAAKAANPTCVVLGPPFLDYNPSAYADFGTADGNPANNGFHFLDAISVHPYIGFSESWEECGYPYGLWANLKSIWTSYGAGSKPVIGTEIAFWHNQMAPAGLVVQADSYIRYYLHGDALGMAGRTAFVVEGCFDFGLDEALITYGGATGDYVPVPSGLASMAYGLQTAGRTCLGYVTGLPPHVWGVRYGPKTGDPNGVLALWTDDAAIPVMVSAGYSSAVTVTGILGKTRTVTATGPAVSVTADGSPTYLPLPAGQTVTIAAPALAGTNACLATNGSSVSVTSDVGGTAAYLTDGIWNTQNNHGGPIYGRTGMPVWSSVFPDYTPAATITFARAYSVQSVVVTSHSIESSSPGLRHADVYGQRPDSTWIWLGSIRNLYYRRQGLVTFPAQSLLAIRVTCRGVNLTDIAGGPVPYTFANVNTSQAADPESHPAWIYEIEAWSAAG